jgi:hypothetical protein
VVWYFDAFEHASGAPQLDIKRAAVLGETCAANQSGCPQGFLLGDGIAPLAKDWLHANSVYYWPVPQDGSKGRFDLVVAPPGVCDARRLPGWHRYRQHPLAYGKSG